jgi:Flp pilus assembly pilin Flp
MTKIKKFYNDETGLELSEYAVAAALIAVACVAAFTALSTSISDALNSLAGKIK